jgi:hypothetical protein
MRRGVSAAGVLVVAILVCASAALAGRIVRVGLSANGKTEVLHPGDVLVVSLPGNPTTGFSWRLRKVDRAVLKLTSSAYIPNKRARRKWDPAASSFFAFGLLWKAGRR